VRSIALSPTSAETCAEQVLEVVPLVMRQIRTEMRSAAAPALTVLQLRALLFVRRNPDSSISALAEHHGVGLTTASALADRLVRQGLLDRQPAPHERRRLMLRLTPLGAKRLDAAVARTSRAVAGALGARTPDELAHIEAAMRALQEAFSASASDGARQP
jgi:DNA-binding MarR family transcriptional regulator